MCQASSCPFSHLIFPVIPLHSTYYSCFTEAQTRFTLTQRHIASIQTEFKKPELPMAMDKGLQCLDYQSQMPTIISREKVGPHESRALPRQPGGKPQEIRLLLFVTLPCAVLTCRHRDKRKALFLSTTCYKIDQIMVATCFEGKRWRKHPVFVLGWIPRRLQTRLKPMNGSAQITGLLCARKELFPKTSLLQGLPRSPSSAPHPNMSPFSLAVTQGKGNLHSHRLVHEMLTDIWTSKCAFSEKPLPNVLEHGSEV